MFKYVQSSQNKTLLISYCGIFGQTLPCFHLLAILLIFDTDIDSTAILYYRKAFQNQSESKENKIRFLNDATRKRVKVRFLNQCPKKFTKREILSTEHQVYRVPGSLSSSELGPRPPHPKGSVASPPFGSQGEDTLAYRGEGRGTQFRRGDRHSGTLGILIPQRT
jgi:hypothetical protein